MSCGNRCCKPCGCCGKRGATVFFALVGLALAAGVIVPPVYVHETDRNYEKLFPILSYGREYLKQVTDKYFEMKEGQQYQYQNNGQFPVEEVAASTIEDLEMKKQNVHNVKVGDNTIDVQQNIQSDGKFNRNQARHNYK